MINKFEIRRKTVHILFGLFIIFLIQIELVAALSLAALAVIMFILTSVSKKYRLPGLYFFFKQFERDREKNFPGKGAVFFFLAASLLIFLFDKNITIASLVILTFGDGVAPLIGMRFGKTPLSWTEKKSVEGQVGGAIAALIGLYIFSKLNLINVLIFDSIVAVAFSMLIEGLNTKPILNKLDDNLLVPLVAGLIFWILKVI